MMLKIFAKITKDLYYIVQSQARDIKEYVKQLKGTQALNTKQDVIRHKLEDEHAKAKRDTFKAKALLDSNEITLNEIKSHYEEMTSKAVIETTAALDKLEL